VSVITTLLPRRAYRWNFTVMGLDFSIFLLGISFTSVYGVLPLFVSHLTPSNLALGLIPAVRSVCTALPPILVAPYTERLRRKKPFLLGMTTFERLPYLALAVAIPLLAGTPPHPLAVAVLRHARCGNAVRRHRHAGVDRPDRAYAARGLARPLLWPRRRTGRPARRGRRDRRDRVAVTLRLANRLRPLLRRHVRLPGRFLRLHRRRS